MDHLAHDHPWFLLGNSLSDFEHYTQVKSIAVVHNHVDIGAGLDGLVQFYCEVTVHHGMQTHFFLNAIHVFSANVCNVYDFASVNPFSCVRCWTISLLLRLLSLFNLIWNLLGLDNLAVLSLSQLLVDVNEEPIYFSYWWLGCCLGCPSSWIRSLCLNLRLTFFFFLFSIGCRGFFLLLSLFLRVLVFHLRYI